MRAPTAVPREDADTSESAALDRGVDFRVVAAKDCLDDLEVARDLRRPSRRAWSSAWSIRCR
ncbi:hypothetical protein ACF06L_35520 [Streptomyces sp. NPDC015408]|uniref:hypothetical protein n=1 Tax=Streptomyces sp. NPDC015408 TaxID=3364956 RepID=UPI0036F553FD